MSLIDFCRDLSDEQQKATVPGVYGSLLDTLRHLVATDRAYLTVYPGVTLPRIDDEVFGLADARGSDGGECSGVAPRPS